ncbi:MAG: cytochrome c oxidase subunit 3, partial [Planctomycetota bacterium]
MPEASTDTPVKQDAAAEAQAAGGHAHAPHLAHHFDTPGQQYEAATLGMWLFLATEILLFGGMFCAYAVYRANHPDVFAVAHEALSKTLGGVNTVILLCSSFTMATGVWAAERGRQRLLGVMLALTILGGLGFLGIKYVEYKHKWEEGLLWGKYYKPHEHDLAAATQHARIGDHPAPGAAPPDVGAQRPWRETTPGHGTEKTGGEPNAAAG